MSNEKRIMKAVGILISELHSRYEGNVKLAMAQLIILGEQAAPYMNAYINKQIEHLSDLDKLDELDRKASKLYDGMNHDEYYSNGKKRQKYEEAKSQFLKFQQALDKKYPSEPDASILESLHQVFEAIGDENNATIAKRVQKEVEKRFNHAGLPP